MGGVPGEDGARTETERQGELIKAERVAGKERSGYRAWGWRGHLQPAEEASAPKRLVGATPNAFTTKYSLPELFLFKC